MKMVMENEEGDDDDDAVKERMNEGDKTMIMKEVKMMMVTKQETRLWSE